MHTALGKRMRTVTGIALVTVKTIESALCAQPDDSLPVLLNSKDGRRVGQGIIVETQWLGYNRQ